MTRAVGQGAAVSKSPNAPTRSCSFAILTQADFFLPGHKMTYSP
jgi:hypothetical protein